MQVLHVQRFLAFRCGVGDDSLHLGLFVIFAFIEIDLTINPMVIRCGFSFNHMLQTFLCEC
jgi:hypothetical protein